jgi:hypothetical protein
MPKYQFQCGRRAGRLGIPKNHLRKRKHVGFWAEVNGQPIHFLGDPGMSEETLDALKEVARAAMKWMDEKGRESDESDCGS